MKTDQQDKAAIAQALQDYYFEGIYQGSLDLLKQIFQPGILLFGDINGQPYAKTLDEYLNGVASRISPQHSGKPYAAQIIDIDVINSIAVAKVNVKMYDFNYFDLLSFNKINGKWLIVNKMLTNVQESSIS